MEDIMEVRQELEDACRLCLDTGLDRSPIFGDDSARALLLVDRIKNCTSVKVSSEDKLTTQICAKCVGKIEDWNLFKELCIKSQKTLNSSLPKVQPMPRPMVTIKEEFQNICRMQEVSNALENQVIVNGSISSEEDDDPPIPEPETILYETNDDSTINIDSNPVSCSPSPLGATTAKEINGVEIKPEPMDSEEEDYVETGSPGDTELLINPLAAVNKNSGVMEADSTQKFGIVKKPMKKKLRRNHTHFRGIKQVKIRCNPCGLILHSKWSYSQHVARIHGPGLPNKPKPVRGTPKIALLEPGVESPEVVITESENSNENLNENSDEISMVCPDERYADVVNSNPLTTTQVNIISQLKTFSCYTCNQCFFDRRHTLNHIRQHMPDLKPYTCIACLSEFPDRSFYKSHCGNSFECAVKIALVVPREGQEKYFTCNMCLRPLTNRAELLDHLIIHDKNKQVQLPQMQSTQQSMLIQKASMLPKKKLDEPKKIIEYFGPYMQGDPNHNHKCDLCGMIYRYKPNLIKHRELCKSLPEEQRTSYRCVQCNMTYLVFKKFHSHLYSEHKKKEIVCFTCKAKFHTSEEFLEHHATHSTKPVVEPGEEGEEGEVMLEGEDGEVLDDSMDQSAGDADKPFACALCSETFATKADLTEHRNLHLKVKIYSCVICRSMFSSSGALEVHMKDHGIEDPKDAQLSGSGDDENYDDSMMEQMQTTIPTGTPSNLVCHECNRGFANMANLKRHQRNVHSHNRRRWCCYECNRRFTSQEDFDRHRLAVHAGTIPKPQLQCPKCPKTFTYQGNLVIHCQNVHNDSGADLPQYATTVPKKSNYASPNQIPSGTGDGFACDICGKAFREEMSLKTHRGWHFRVNYRSKSLAPPKVLSPDKMHLANHLNAAAAAAAEGTQPYAPRPAKTRKSFPNQPIQAHANQVADLGLQCQVCDDRFGDLAELRKHLWDVHCSTKTEPVFDTEEASDGLSCELCTKTFPDEETLNEHMEWHDQQQQMQQQQQRQQQQLQQQQQQQPQVTFCCQICNKKYSNKNVFLEHQKLHRAMPLSVMKLQSLQQAKRRPTCTVCQKTFSTENSLRRHKISHGHIGVAKSPPALKKINYTGMSDPLTNFDQQQYQQQQPVKREPGMQPVAAAAEPPKKKPVTCAICKVQFPNLSILYQHRQMAHNKMPIIKEKPMQPMVSNEGYIYCNVCGKQFTGLMNLKQHFAHKHKNQPGTFVCGTPGCGLAFSSANALKSHESCHKSMIFTCHLCDRHFFNKGSILKHMLTMHKAVYDAGAPKNSLYSETDLTKYQIKGAIGTACPKCKIKYPNLRALKIHYFKFHERY